MKSKTYNPIVVTITIFTGLAIAYAVLILAAKSMADPFAQSVMVSIGSAIFGSGVTFFMIRISQLDQSNTKPANPGNTEKI